MLPCVLINYLVNRTAYDETTAWCMFHIAWNLWAIKRKKL